MAKCLESPYWSLTCLGHGCLQVFVVYLLIYFRHGWDMVPNTEEKKLIKKSRKRDFYNLAQSETSIRL